ncbi:MAG: precorrin-6y C5,15-methyltransferase (decarboxylating) subunit CbiE [Planctomycetes bacterium]|nr:precorrin-6y C5,15-methyltransferase (decarboxylating) subunit CbiE [Planctomycetota bacterium]
MAATREKVHIIGIGDDGLEGLTAGARDLLQGAELIFGSPHTLEAVADLPAERIPVGIDLDRMIARIEADPNRRSVVLATGDPLFYGTARFLVQRLGKEHCEVVPSVSTMQLAFARVKESWDEAYLADLANHPLGRIVEKVRLAEKAGLFTSEAAPPAAVAAALLDQKIDYFTAYVCENLGSPDERVTHAELAEVAQQEFSPLNVLILVRKPEPPDRPNEMRGRRLFGNPDDAFLQSQPHRGLLTPAEVRAITLSELDLGLESVFWDVGAGSGSVAIEAAQIAKGGTAYAIEMDPEDHQLIAANVQRFGVSNVKPVLGKAPEAWKGLPTPDAVFVGGAGRSVGKIAEQAYERLKPGGRIVVNVNSVENVAAVREVLHAASGDAAVRMVQISRGIHQLERMRFEALNPTFLITAVKPAAK